MEPLCPTEAVASSSGGFEAWGCKAGSGVTQVWWRWNCVWPVSPYSFFSPHSRHLQVPEDGAAEAGL